MKENKTGLEEFVGRHRADFDTFEPRPDLWDAIERSLEADAAPAESAPAPLRVVPQPSRAKVLPLAATRTGTYRYAIAATLALLMLAGLGVLWTQNRAQPTWQQTGTATVAVTAAPAAGFATPFSLGSEPVATAAGEAPAQRVAAAVLRMENYYAVQIRERQAELDQLNAQLGAGPTDWQREMTSLDSTYQQLKVELARNPAPDVVLDAMNRNLQIRLDILNQQLRTRAQVQEYSEAVPKP
ncbi:hypothetical protein [Hymenobacter algoricola]|uniref:Anti-sigma factor n=1 Tax=Hymenobacter algoricola TaxID=486267 RepID=A0ABP7MGE3_9BACT